MKYLSKIETLMEPRSQLRSFTLFPALPIELQLKIWQCAISWPRDVTLQYRHKYDEMNGDIFCTFAGWTSPDPVPLVLHICHKSREEGLKSYQPSFGQYSDPPKIYFEFSKDTLRFGTEAADDYPSPTGMAALTNFYLLGFYLGAELYKTNDIERVKFMTVEVDETAYKRRKFIWEEIRLFSALRELIIVPSVDFVVGDDLMLGCQNSLAVVTREHPEWSVPKITVVTVFGTVLGALKVQV